MNITELLTNIDLNHNRKIILQNIIDTSKPKQKTFKIYKITNPDLQFIGHGVPHAVYYEPELNGVVKFKKGEREITAKFFPSNVDVNDFKMPDYIKDNIDKFKKINEIIKDLPLFLQIIGYAWYPELADEYGRIMFSPVYEYFPDLKDNWIYNKKNFIDIIREINKLNMRGYKHGDFQTQCNNIVYIPSSDTLKIIDIDSVKAFVPPGRKVYLKDVTYDFFGDILDMAACFKNKTHIDIDNIKQQIENELRIMFMNNNFEFYKTTLIPEDPWVEYANFRPNIVNGKFINPDIEENYEDMWKKILNEQYIKNIAVEYNNDFKMAILGVIEKIYQILLKLVEEN
jgi:hypothetical protein